MAWSFSFLFDSFKDPLPWINPEAKSASNLQNLWNPNYFYGKVLNRSGGADEPGGLVGPMVWCMFLSYILTYISVWRGFKSTGKMVYISCILPYIILTILFLKGLTLDGCSQGLSALFTPDWSHLTKVGVWKNAAT